MNYVILLAYVHETFRLKAICIHSSVACERINVAHSATCYSERNISTAGEAVKCFSTNQVLFASQLLMSAVIVYCCGNLSSCPSETVI
jgi:hypothetical protein